MKTIELKTNIMCAACIEKVTPALDETAGRGNWNVDTQNPKKILTVSGEQANEAEVIRAVEKAGYKAEKVA